jgi:hypothetical protein
MRCSGFSRWPFTPRETALRGLRQTPYCFHNLRGLDSNFKRMEDRRKEFVCNLPKFRAAHSLRLDSCFSYCRYTFFFLRRGSPAAPPRLRQLQRRENK